MGATWKDFFLVLILISPNFSASSSSTEIINSIQSLKDGETIVSSGGMFELGFFSPANSKNRYVGIWYHGIPVQTIVWVANRESPLTNQAGVLKVMQPGLLVVLVNDTGEAVWSSKRSSRSAHTPVTQLLDSGNLVLKDAEADDREENYLWQSFDHPSDTYLPGMKFGWNFVTGVEAYLAAWKTDDDPAPGDFTNHLELEGYPQLVLRRNATKVARYGPWNGIFFSGLPAVRGNPVYSLHFVMDKNIGVYYQENLYDMSVLRRLTLNSSGFGERLTWVNRTQKWEVRISRPSDNCDSYSLCGAYGICYIENIPACDCLDRFVPKDSEGWIKTDWSSGCIRRTNLSCQGDGFIKYSRIKLPDAQNSWFNDTMRLKECAVECLKNCSCMAYTQLNISSGSGCLLWFGELVDIRSLSADGLDIYIRMASSELLDSSVKKRRILISSLASVMGIILLALSLILYIRKTNKDSTKAEEGGKYNENKHKELELPLFKLATILKATNCFSIENKLGEGGFGPVYKGILEGGEEIAVKCLSRTSTQGIDEFKNEVICIAKLQHRNLVRLLGCCIQKDEYMLIYEYMPNKSLDLILFDETTGDLLDWPHRFHIINGIARGLLYLHQDSRLRIIHRDLKASNILLDSDMNPKISDFGTARSFGGNETEAQTHRVVGTYGYMSPEYVVDGIFSVKSDVFSFGVLVLEIVSGKRNRGFSHSDHHLNLLGHAWTLYKEERSHEVAEASLRNPQNLAQVIRSIHVGLLCVQQNPEDRPSMSSVVLMLGNEGMLPEAKQPGFFTERQPIVSQNSTTTNATNSSNQFTITVLDPR
ncbi:G-type lectin S-receptor-like serine/threonine-protein kinase At4g27290 [Henckelia pumila]|uniref:G-type lectin S-receptor-like serine/threonine-protein kinase At4g27290 n=1 Tax=Henckelia pumila TaxID=405737 RepID=UPI003C6DE86F